MKNYLNPTGCPCGKNHTISIDDVLIGSGVVKQLPAIVSKYGKKPFVVADVNTYAAAGAQVCDLLKASSIPYSCYVFRDAALEPDEKSVGSAIMHYDHSCDVIVGVGSGVINAPSSEPFLPS